MENKEKELELITNKMNQLLTSKSKSVIEAIQQIERTGSLLDDFVVPTQSIQFIRVPDPDEIRLTFKPDTYHGESFSPFRLHDHAIGQIGEKLIIPPAYLKTLVYGTDWQKLLALQILQMTTDNITRERVLVRTMEGQVRGFLTDKYRRLNSMEIFKAFLQGAKDIGGILVDAYSGETKGFLEVINPKIIEFDTPQNGRNYAVVGARIRNSDFGDGALEVYLYFIMVKCWNGAVGETLLREVHLGGRIPDDIRISEETYRKDTAAKASLVSDVMRQLSGPEYTNRLINKIQGASAKQIDIIKEVEKLPKLGLTTLEAESVGRVLMENNPDNGLEGGATLWKLVNAMTAVARDSAPDRKRDLELIAGDMLKDRI